MIELGENYYNILEVSKTSSFDEIKASFRRLAINFILIKIMEIKLVKTNSDQF